MAKQNEIKNDVQSVFEKMQEVYRDCREQKKKLMSTIRSNKMKFPAEDIDDAATMGKMENDQMKMLNDLIDKKIKLIQIHTKLVSYTTKSDSGNKTTDEVVKLSDEELKALRDNMEAEWKREVKYDLEG